MSDPQKPKKRALLVAAARGAPSALPAATDPPPAPRTIINLSGQSTTFSASPPRSEAAQPSQAQSGSSLAQRTTAPPWTETKPSFPTSPAPAAQAESSTSGNASPEKSASASQGAPLSRASSASGSSTPQILPQPGASQASQGGIAKMKFKPRVPVRQRPKQEPDIKPDVSTVPSRGTPRARGRGAGQRGRGNYQSVSVAAGPFGARTAPGKAQSRRIAPAPAPRSFDFTEADVYSDNDSEYPSSGRIIDIDQVSSMHESAPTSLLRNRRDGKSRSKSHSGSQSRDRSRGTTRMDVDHDLPPMVKDEPMSPEKSNARLADLFAEDEPSKAERVRTFARTGGMEPEEEVNEANKVDLSESESEEEEEDLRGDFVPGTNGESDKLYIFQFPHLFPHFIPPGPIDVTAEEDVKPDVKPTAAQLKAKAKGPAPPPPEGRIGTMVVMKSGRVKMVLGKDIVMDVNSGIQTNFLQQIVHLDSAQKSATVLGEVHKQYTVTPDIDRLLHELYIHGGQTPADKEAEKKRLMRDVKVERGLVKMEVD